MKTNSLSFGDKRTARAALLKTRESIGDGQGYSDLLCRGIAILEEYKNADTILLYFPTRSEPDLSPLAKAAWREGKKVAFPISRTDSLTLDFRLVSSLDELCVGAYGIREPNTSAKRAEITVRTLCVVPALAVDMDGFRLGYGKGYYDRFLAQFNGRALTALHSSLVCDRLPREETDIPIDTIITETGAIRLR